MAQRHDLNRLAAFTLGLGLCSSCAFDELSSELSSESLPGSQDIAQNSPPNIVGPDDRKNGYELSGYHSALMSNYIVSVVSNDSLTKESGGWKASFRNTLRNSPQKFDGFDENKDERVRVCSDLRFIDEKRLGSCSGTLISENIVVTAGHCVLEYGTKDGELDPQEHPQRLRDWCRGHSFVFDFMRKSRSKVSSFFDHDDVYGCERVLTIRDEGRQDWAFIQLSRPVVGHNPASVVSSDSIPAIGDRTIAMTHPKSLPGKYDDGGVVTAYLGNDAFESTLDTFSSSSGGGIFDSRHRLAGIHTRSPEDFILSSEMVDGKREKCLRYNRLETSPDNAATHARIDAALDDFCLFHSHFAPQACRVPIASDACIPCSESSDCGPGITCVDYDGEGIGRCLLPCRRDADCSFGSFCSAETTGFCEPIETSRCLGTGVVLKLDACGIPSGGGPEDCPVDSQCVRGRCRYSSSSGFGAACDDSIPLNLQNRATRVHGSTRYGAEHVQSTCSIAMGRTAIYSFELEEAELIHATAFGHDTVLMLRKDCESNESEIRCDNDGLGDFYERGSEISQSLEAGKYFLLVQSKRPADSKAGKPFQLDVRIVRPTVID